MFYFFLKRRHKISALIKDDGYKNCDLYWLLCKKRFVKEIFLDTFTLLMKCLE